MWLHTQFGFFSITRSILEPQKFQIRARLRADLCALLATYQAHQHNAHITEADIIETPARDYRYRVIVHAGVVSTIMLMLVSTTDYNNFKGRIAETPGQADKLHDLHTIWDITHGWQQREPRGRIVGQPAPLDPRAERAVGGGPRDGGGFRVDSGTIPPTGKRKASTLPPTRSPLASKIDNGLKSRRLRKDQKP